MNTLTLQRNVQFLYEAHLAAIELQAFGCDQLQPSPDDWRTLRAHVNGNTSALVERAAYVGSIDDQPTVYQELIRPAYQGGLYNRTRSVNQYLTHWIYPYRGKFHPQMVRALLNILRVRPGMKVLEPYLGSGTAALEASLLGADVIGVDLSPLCVLLARVKSNSWRSVAAIRRRVHDLLADDSLRPERLKVEKEDDTRVREFLEIARMVTLSDVSRRSRESASSFRKNLSAMLESVESHALAIKKFNLKPGVVATRVGDCRNLAGCRIAPDSIDAIVTSPPYSIALDYVKNDEHALDALSVDTTELRSAMTGVRGRGAKQKLALYNEDMKVMFSEVARVLKPGAGAAFVIGDATVDGSEVTTTEEMAGWAESAGLRRERSIPKIVFGLYNVMQDEKILVFRKP
jgi:SAM-dependent methyltransferase